LLAAPSLPVSLPSFRLALALGAPGLAALLQSVELLHGLAQHLLLAGQLGQLFRHGPARFYRFLKAAEFAR
jgi:hypothetical protein